MARRGGHRHGLHRPALQAQRSGEPPGDGSLPASLRGRAGLHAAGHAHLHRRRHLEPLLPRG
ncbi:hypothetical protein B7486_70740, partial [cyanobacterium TDX16]